MSPTMVIVFATAAFLLMVLSLTMGLMAARAKLVNTGAVKIDINDGEKIIEVPAGGTLLNTLSAQKIFIPSACGGGFDASKPARSTKPARFHPACAGHTLRSRSTYQFPNF